MVVKYKNVADVMSLHHCIFLSLVSISKSHKLNGHGVVGIDYERFFYLLSSAGLVCVLWAHHRLLLLLLSVLLL